VFKQKPAIEDRRLGQFLTGDSVKNSPALTKENFTFNYVFIGDEVSVNGHDKIDINGHEKPAKPVI